MWRVLYFMNPVLLSGTGIAPCDLTAKCSLDLTMLNIVKPISSRVKLTQQFINENEIENWFEWKMNNAEK